MERQHGFYGRIDETKYEEIKAHADIESNRNNKWIRI